jgi:oligosaccharide reducing-end xylanase
VACNALLGFGVPALRGAGGDRHALPNELWTKPIPTGKYRYYDGMLHLLALLHVSGKFQLWY